MLPYPPYGLAEYPSDSDSPWNLWQVLPPVHVVLPQEQNTLPPDRR